MYPSFLSYSEFSLHQTGNEDRLKTSDKFELEPDLNNHFGVMCS